MEPELEPLEPELDCLLDMVMLKAVKRTADNGFGFNEIDSLLWWVVLFRIKVFGRWLGNTASYLYAV